MKRLATALIALAALTANAQASDTVKSGAAPTAIDYCPPGYGG
jgi:hypothetical protein